MSGWGLPLALAGLVLVLAGAVTRPRGLPEVVFAAPVAIGLLGLRLIGPDDVRAQVEALWPTLAFLGLILALAHLADAEGVFAYLGYWTAHRSRGRPSAHLLGSVFLVAALVTAGLSLDATVVLLTPAVLAAAVRLGARPRPHVYACAHLANSASLLLPVSNLTNLLAFHASGLSFVGFAALMALPWATAVGVEYLVARGFFADDLRARLHDAAIEPVAAPRTALWVLGLALVGFAVAPELGLGPAWVALAAVIALQGARLRRGCGGLGRTLAATNPSFLLFVVSLAVIVDAARRSGLDRAVDALVPTGTSLADLALVALLAALLANLLNNLPATLLLLPAVAGHPPLLMAVLLGVNIGPNLTYVGSLATLLWRQVLDRHDRTPRTATYLRLGLVSTPLTLAASVLALWLSLRTAGMT